MGFVVPLDLRFQIEERAAWRSGSGPFPGMLRGAGPALWFQRGRCVRGLAGRSGQLREESQPGFAAVKAKPTSDMEKPVADPFPPGKVEQASDLRNFTEIPTGPAGDLIERGLGNLDLINNGVRASAANPNPRHAAGPSPAPPRSH